VAKEKSRPKPALVAVGGWVNDVATSTAFKAVARGTPIDMPNASRT
jgi:hypothetical protein